MKTLIIGKGEIGTSLQRVLSPFYETYIRDIEPLEVEGIEVLHICFPYSKKFIKQVEEYKKQYKPRFVIIHSTVPVGTCAKLGVFHSPVRGIHPHLEQSLLTFVKYLAPFNQELTDYFEKAHIQIKQVSETKTTELLKLYCTTIYGVNIIAQKEVMKECKRIGADFDIVYTDCNESYNKYYEKLGFPKFKKYVLDYMEGGIGNHCVLPNCKLLKKNSSLAKFILKENKKYIK
jgi:hypothetical protein